MSKQLVVAIGDYGSGKSTFAKWYARKNKATYADYDLLHFHVDFDAFFERLASVVREADGDVVLDGWGDFPPRLALLDSFGVDVQMVYCFAAPHILRQRQSKKNAAAINETFPRSMEDITYRLVEHYRVLTSGPYDVRFVDTSDGIEYVDNDKALQRISERIFLSKLDAAEHDKYYQRIELPSGVTVEGYTDSEATWQRLAELDFKGKSVLDIGSFHGYFSFKAEEAGATSVKGVDTCEPAIGVAREIAYLRHSRCDFVHGSAEGVGSEHTYDIIFLLNMIHHTQDPEAVIDTMLRIGGLVVFEVNYEPWHDKIMARAGELGHEVTVAGSQRDGRVFLFCRNPAIHSQPVNVTAYPYHHRRARLKHAGMLLLAKVYWWVARLIRYDIRRRKRLTLK